MLDGEYEEIFERLDRCKRQLDAARKRLKKSSDNIERLKARVVLHGFANINRQLVNEIDEIITNEELYQALERP